MRVGAQVPPRLPDLPVVPVIEAGTQSKPWTTSDLPRSASSRYSITGSIETWQMASDGP